jgi:hypothetical protein
MKINQDNYEQYFLDHVEGNLSPEMERELELFLEANPDLKPALENYDPSPLPRLEITSNHLKNRLKKNIRPTIHIDETNVDEWLSAKGEGQLSELENIELEDFIKLNPAYKYDLNLMMLSRLEPDLAVTFPGKERLKKKAAILPLTRMAWAIPAAAVILILVGIKFLNKPEVVNNPNVTQEAVQQVAEGKQVNEPKAVAVAEILNKEKGTPSQGTPSQGTPSQGTPSQGTPSQGTPSQGTPSSFRITATESIALIDNNFPEDYRLLLSEKRLPEMEFIEKKQPSLLAKAFSNKVLRARNVLKKNPGVEKIRNADVNFWSIAEAGVKGFNTVTDRDLELKVRKDVEGRVKSYALVEDDHLIYSKNRVKN